MSTNLLDKINKGITPGQFIEGMTKNKEQFEQWKTAFAWKNEEDRQFFQALSKRDDLLCFILMADWCGDVVRNVPVIFNALEISNIPVEVLIIEEHMETMDQFLTLGGRSIPIVIFTNKKGAVLGQWGPRPQYVQEPMIAFKKANPDREAADYQTNLAETRKEIIRRYGEGTGYQADIITELRALLETI
ncbi:thioredoxin family protein [Paenibacillus sp. IITD108]|uniref:thioredoxin family protein n=1 Tax=Paenibacillus sp. IITD108 TaxID=3116649 RepID=UPI002F3F1594